jgi:plastocyanin/sugar lactone lactonase YvrE
VRWTLALAVGWALLAGLFAPLDAVASGPSGPGGDYVIVRLRGKAFDPPVVTIHEGDTIVWVNETKGGWHDVRSYEGLFASPHLFYGNTFTWTFAEAGVYGVLCSPHVIDGMQMTVIVLPPGEPLPDLLPRPAAFSPTRVDAEVVAPGLPGTIQTVAGGAGVAAPAAGAALFLPEGVALGRHGLYIADTGNCQIRRVDGRGLLTSVLGHDSCGYSMGADGDLGPWLHTNGPAAVAGAADGTVYVADTLNCRVRRVGGDGLVALVAGSGSCRASGDGGPALQAGLSPWGLAFDEAGDLYVADVFNCRVRKIDAAGVITTVAGADGCGFAGDGGPAEASRLSFPRDVAVGAGGALYVADSENCRVRRIRDGLIDTIAGSGRCDDLRPWAVAAGGNALLIADRDACRVWRLDDSGALRPFAGTGACGYGGDGGPATRASLNAPGDLAAGQDGAVYVAETGSCRVRRIEPSGTIDTVAGSGACAPGGDGGAATAAGAWHPMGLETAPDGSWFFSELDTCRVRRIDAGGVIWTIAGTGRCGYDGDGGPAVQASLGDVGGLARGPDGSLYVADGHNCRVRQIDSRGEIHTVAGNGRCDFGGDGGPATAAGIGYVSDVALDGRGGLLIASPFHCRVRRVDLATGVIETVAGSGHCEFAGERSSALEAGINPWGVAPGPDGSVYVADGSNCRVRRVERGRLATIAGGATCGYAGDGGPATAAQLFRPQDIAVDREGNVYVADLRAFAVRKIDTEGTISTVAGVGISRPIDIGGFDPTGGLLCSLHHLPLPVPSYLNDGAPATQAGLYFPYAVALGLDGHLYIADTFDHRVRRVACGSEVPCAGSAAAPPPSVGGDVPPARPAGGLRLPSVGTGAPDGSRQGVPFTAVGLAALSAVSMAVALACAARRGR